MPHIPCKPPHRDNQDCRAQPNRPMTHGYCPFVSVMEMLAQWRSASAKNYGIAFGMFVLGNAPPRVIPRSAMKLTRSHLAGPNAPAIVRFETDERKSRD